MSSTWSDTCHYYILFLGYKLYIVHDISFKVRKGQIGYVSIEIGFDLIP